MTRPLDAERPPTERVHLRHVEGLRAVAALVVFVNHAFAQSWNPYRNEHPPEWLSPFSYSLVAGHLSVTVFIVVSGFCLALPVAESGELRGGVAQFLKRRARRILPPYYAALLFCLLLIATVLGKPTGTLWDVPILVSTTSVVSHLLLLQNLFGTGSINYVFWSIAVEWQIYLLFPLLVMAWRRAGPVPVIVAALVIGYLITLVYAGSRIAHANPHFVGMFALGMFAAFVTRSREERYLALREGFPFGWVATGGLVATITLVVLWGVERSIARYHLLDLPIGIAAAAFLATSAQTRRSWVIRAFEWRPLVLIGTFSYSLYLLHAPCLQLLWQFLLEPLRLSPVAIFASLLSLGLVAILLTARGFYLLFEAPFLRQSPRLVGSLSPRT